MGKIIECKTCGTQMDWASKSCPNCGAKKFTKSKLGECKKCGSPLAKSAKRCPNCGAIPHLALQVIAGVLIGLLVLLFIVAIFSNDTEYTPGTSSSPATRESNAPQAIEIDASDLWAVYDENELNADGQYKNKVLSVTGTVSEITRDLLTDKPCILLKANDSIGIYSIQCYFSDKSEYDAVSSVRDGDEITITGTCKGKTINVILNNCSISGS